MLKRLPLIIKIPLKVASPIGKATSQTKSIETGIIGIEQKPIKEAVKAVSQKFSNPTVKKSMLIETNCIIPIEINVILYFLYFLTNKPPTTPPITPKNKAKAPKTPACQGLKPKGVAKRAIRLPIVLVLESTTENTIKIIQ
jgi:hypothetical protein